MTRTEYQYKALSKIYDERIHESLRLAFSEINIGDIICAKITLISLLATVLTFVMMVPAYAHDSNSSILNLAPFNTTDTTHDLYYDISDLDNVTLDGASNGAGLRLIGEVGRAAIDTTDFTLTEDTTLDYGDSRLDARYYSGTNYYG